MNKRLDEMKLASDVSGVPTHVVELKKNINSMLDETSTVVPPPPASITPSSSVSDIKAAAAKDPVLDGKIKAAIKFMDETKKNMDLHYPVFAKKA